MEISHQLIFCSLFSEFSLFVNIWNSSGNLKESELKSRRVTKNRPINFLQESARYMLSQLRNIKTVA